MELRRLANQANDMVQAVNSQQKSPSADYEDIDIFCGDAYFQDEPAFIDQHSPCPQITFQKLVELLGPQVLYAKAGSDNPHQHDGFMGTKLLKLESDESSTRTEEIFCIVTHADHPIVLNKSLKPTSTEPAVLTMGLSVAKKKEEEFKKEAKAKAKAIEKQRAKEKGPGMTDKMEKERKVLNEEGQTQTK